MGKRLIFLFITLAGIFFFNCKDESLEVSPEERIKSIKDNYRKKIKDHYEIQDSSSSKEKAIEKFLNSIALGKKDIYSCSKEEYLEMFLPNSVDEKTLTAGMEPEKAWEITKFRRDSALQSLESKILNKNFVIQDIKWKRENRELHNLIGHQVGSVIINSNNNEITIEEIKLVIEHNNQFKVCVYAR
ncbi:MAG: hypothetical protein KDK36_19410 [Leptospiraceae bacterium]|nr:hypothetical protein [Leptospiraceae bacterium]